MEGGKGRPVACGRVAKFDLFFFRLQHEEKNLVHPYILSSLGVILGSSLSQGLVRTHVMRN
jgi:hypothetical protein